MRMRRVIGIVLCVIGLVWFLQGIDVLGGSGMSGHAFWAVAGVLLAVIGISLLRDAHRGRRGGQS